MEKQLMKGLAPYLNFKGNTREAMQFYADTPGGKILMELQDTFWGAKFGMITDKFGVNWMFNCATGKQG